MRSLWEFESFASAAGILYDKLVRSAQLCWWWNQLHITIFYTLRPTNSLCLAEKVSYPHADDARDEIFLTNGRACAFLLISLRASLAARSRCEWDNVWELTQFPMQQIQIDWSHAELLWMPRSHEVITPKKWALIERKQTKPANFFCVKLFRHPGQHLEISSSKKIDCACFWFINENVRPNKSHFARNLQNYKLILLMMKIQIKFDSNNYKRSPPVKNFNPRKCWLNRV
jgi:hypothetical protein